MLKIRDMNLYTFCIIRKNNIFDFEIFFEFDKYIAFLISDNIIFIHIFFLELEL